MVSISSAGPDLSVVASRGAIGEWTSDDPVLEAGARRLEHARLKRLMDFSGALIGLVLLSPFFLLVAIFIVVESRGSPLFKQRRSGFNGAPFVIYKFRTMRVREDGPTIVQAVKDDNRITAVGRILRRTSVDEIPQLINVLRGDMSLIGPRPHALAHDEYYGALVPGYAMRFRTKPGISGLAQVCGLRGQTENVEAMAARVAKDLEYIRCWSFFLDLKILCNTVLVFAFQSSAY